MKNVLIGVLLATIVACSPAKENDLVDSNGYCKAALADSYNGTLAQIKALTNYSTLEEFRAVDASCKGFKSMMTGQSCKAKDETGATLNVNEDSLDKGCGLVRTAVEIREAAQKINDENKAREKDKNSVKNAPSKRSK